MDDSKATLGELIKKLPIHGSLKKGVHGLYGFASDKSGIRHSGKKEDNTSHKVLEYSDALFSLIICSSIINYISQKS